LSARNQREHPHRLSVSFRKEFFFQSSSSSSSSWEDGEHIIIGIIEISFFGLEKVE